MSNIPDDANSPASRVDLTFWGKAQPGPEGPVPFHPLAYHSLDVAAVAQAMLMARPLTREKAGHLLRMSPSDACRLLVALIALHDLGKFTPAFQAKCPELLPDALGSCDAALLRGKRHTDDGYVLWEGVLSSDLQHRLWPNGIIAMRALALALFGHHGRPVGAEPFRPTAAQVFGAAGLAAAQSCADAIVRLLQPEPVDAEDLTSERARLASWWVAGLTTVADWVGSNRVWFEYTAPMDGDASLARYWERARIAAQAAVRGAGLVTPRVAALKLFSELTGLRETPSPAQEWAQHVKLPAGQVLVIIEDVTGSGKTEAAQMLVHRLMSSGRATGVYWAMPTQATANAMYGRQAGMIDALFDSSADALPSLVLAHGQQRLHEKFRSTVLRPEEDEKVRAQRDVEDGESSSSASCTAFIADDRRAAMLADIGAGSVDQALLGVLPTKFNAVRLFGLSEKVLVVDEAHAYDAYMGVELQELLRFHAALGGSAIVLSATLPLDQRELMVAAWVEGVGGGTRRASVFAPAPRLTTSSAYPLTTVVGNSSPIVCEKAIEAAPRSRRVVPLRFVNAVSAAQEEVSRATRTGGAVAWIRNTVDDCLKAAELLRAEGLEPLVFHARFAQGDRQRREEEILRLFGPHSSAEDRRGRVVVATQVIEQSLDLDFDRMVSDIAPVDLLIQRAGRLRRHPWRDATRPDGIAGEFVVLGPPFVEDALADWLGGEFAGTAKVYRKVDVLWRTLRALNEKRTISVPDDVRVLIESVYDSADVPEQLLAIADRAQAEERGNAATATYATLKVTHGYDAGAQAWVNEVHARTRLSEDDTPVRLARVCDDGSLAPWVQSDGPSWKGWALSEVRVRAWRVPRGSRPEARFDSAIAQVRQSWGRYEQDIPVLPLLPVEADGFEGRIRLPDADTVRRLCYDRDLGLRFHAEE